MKNKLLFILLGLMVNYPLAMAQEDEEAASANEMTMAQCRNYVQGDNPGSDSDVINRCKSLCDKHSGNSEYELVCRRINSTQSFAEGDSSQEAEEETDPQTKANNGNAQGVQAAANANNQNADSSPIIIDTQEALNGFVSSCENAITHTSSNSALKSFLSAHTNRNILPQMNNPGRCEDGEGIGSEGFFVQGHENFGLLQDDIICSTLLNKHCADQVDAISRLEEDEGDRERNALKQCFDTNVNRFKAAYHNRIMPCAAFAATIGFADQEIVVGDQYTTSDGKYACQKKSKYTVDYKSCMRTMIVYDTLMISAQTAETGMQLNISNRQAELAEDQAEGAANGDAHRSALSAMHDNLGVQKNTEAGRIGMYSAQFAAYSAMLASYVTPRNFASRCGYEVCQTALDTIAENENQQLMANLFANQYVMGAFTQEIMNAAGQLTAAGVRFKHYNDQQDVVNDAIADLDSIEEQIGDDTTVSFDNAFCASNPTNSRCQAQLNGNFNTTGGFSFSGASLGDNNGQVVDLNTDSSSGSNSVARTNSDSSTDSAAIDDLRDIMNSDDPTRANSHDFVAPGAAKISGGGGSGGGGGGGGGAAGGGGGGGGGGAPSEAEAGQSGSSRAAREARVKYANAGSGNSGSSRNNANRRKNPFDQMFKKDKNTRSTASVVEKDIQSKKVDLFERISKRYDNIIQQRRLKNIVKTR